MSNFIVKNDNVMTLRYEDISLNQWEVSNKIYDFIGHKMPNGLKHWIKTNSESDEANESDPYSTKRNSTYVITKWRHQHDFNEIFRVQEQGCKKFMSKCGYELAEDPEDMQGSHFNPIKYEGDYAKWKPL